MKVIQYVSGNIPDRIKPCLDSIKKVYPQVEVFTFPASDRPLYESDKWRWNMMLENDDVLYIDWDISITKPFEFKDNGRPSMLYFNGQPDNCLMYSPKMEVFRKYEDERIRRGIKFETHGWFRKVLRDKKINEIPDGTYEHIRISGYGELVRQYNFK